MTASSTPVRDPLEQLAGRFVSPLGTVLDAVQAPGEPRLGCLVVEEADATPLGARTAYSGRGFGVARSETLLTALGETFERYSLLGLNEGLTVRAPATEWRRRGIDHLTPADLLGLARHQNTDALRLGALDPAPPPDQPMLWVHGLRLDTGDPAYLPARYCVMFDHEQTGPAADEGHWYCATSNGAASAPTATEACLRGALELLERDAFMLMWYHRIRFPFLPVAASSPLGRRIAAVAGSRLECRLIDLTEVHGVPVVVSAVRGEVNGDVQIGIGGGAGATLAEAGWRAAKEALAFYAWQRKQIARGTVQRLEPEDVRTFPDHPMFYMRAEHQRELDFLFDERAPRRPAAIPRPYPGSPAEVLHRMVTRLHGRDIDLYAVDLTPAEADGLPLRTFKVVSPQLLPLDCDHLARHLWHERLRLEPTRRGWRPDVPALEDLNHAPHPFP